MTIHDRSFWLVTRARVAMSLEGDVHDRRVEHDHELADREHEQGHALVHLATVGVAEGSRPGPGAVVVTSVLLRRMLAQRP